MIKLIHTACQWGQHSFDGWLIAKARYCRYSSVMPVSYEAVPLKSTSRYVRLKTTAYGADKVPCQSLEIWLLDSPPQSPVRSISPDRINTMEFKQEGLKQFLSDSGDTNPIHCGPDAVIPGLWILNRLSELYDPDGISARLTIRFLHPVCADQAFSLSRNDNQITGMAGETACFFMDIQF